MVNKERYGRIKEYLDSCRDCIIRDLSMIASIASVREPSDNPDEPFGRPCSACLDVCADLFRLSGFHTTVFKKDGYALISTDKANKNGSLGIFVHTDVVPANPEHWKYASPFKPELKDGCLIGRGVNDDKSGVINSLYLLRTIKALGITPKHNITVFLGSSEETGMEDAENFAKSGQMPLFSLVPDGEYPLAYGQKGIYRFEVTTGKVSCLREISGGSALNIVLDKVTATLKADKMPQNLPDGITVSGTPENCTLVSVGQAVHAFRATDGVNALYPLCNYLSTFDGIPVSDRRIFFYMAHSLSSADGSPFGINGEKAPFGGLTCCNGTVSCADGKITYTFDVRFPGALTEEQMSARVRAYFKDIGFEYEDIEMYHLMLCPNDSPEVTAFMDGYRALTGDKTAQPFVMGGATYAYYLKNAYSIGSATPYTGSFNPGKDHGDAHEPDEFICIDNLIEGIALNCELLLETDEAI